MFKNYLKTAFRNLTRPKGYSLINIVGFVIGIACGADIALWIFLVSGILGLGVAVATVSYQSLKASIANPVDSLRYE